MSPEQDEDKAATGRAGRALRMTGFGVKSCEKLGDWNTLWELGLSNTVWYGGYLPIDRSKARHKQQHVCL